MYNDKLVYKVVIGVFYEISLWKEKVALIPRISLLSNSMGYMLNHLCTHKKLSIIGIRH